MDSKAYFKIGLAEISDCFFLKFIPISAIMTVFQLVVLNSLHSLKVRIFDMDIRTSDSAESINASSVSSSDVLQGSSMGTFSFSFSIRTMVCLLLVDRVEQ